VDRHLGIESDLESIRADDAPAEDAARQALDVVPLECLERNHRDLGGVGNLAERKTATLAGLAQLVAESACAFLCTHVRGMISPPMLNRSRSRRTTSFIGRSGSAKSPMAERPLAPAPATSDARSTDMPPMPRTGTATACAMAESPGTPSTAACPGFDVVGKTVPATR